MKNELATTDKTPTGKYALAVTSPKAIELSKKNLQSTLAEIIARAYYDCGYRIDTPDLALMAANLADEIKNYFASLSVEDVKLALANGSRGQYGEFTGLSIALFHRWLRAHQTSANRLNALKALPAEDHTPVIDREKIESDWKAHIQKQFKTYKETGQLSIEFPTHQYREFEKRGLIKFSNEKKKELFNTAKENITEMKKLRRLNAKNGIERNAIKSFLDRLNANSLKGNEQEEIKQEARRLAIKEFYDSVEVLELEGEDKRKIK